MFICITTTYANGDSLTVTTDRHQASIAKTYTKTDRVIYEDTEAEYGSETIIPGYTETLVTNEYDELGKLTKAIDNCSDTVYNYCAVWVQIPYGKVSSLMHMCKYGGPNNYAIGNKKSYNQIWSPGRKYYLEDYGEYYNYGGRNW